MLNTTDVHTNTPADTPPLGFNPSTELPQLAMPLPPSGGAMSPAAGRDLWKILKIAIGIAGLAMFWVAGIAALRHCGRLDFGEGVLRSAGGVLMGLAGLALTLLGALVTLLSTTGFSRGRQLRRFGRVLLPGLSASDDWNGSPVAALDNESPPARLAEQWRENGKTEHASVAAFARLTLDLMALGAPPALVEAANRDALDEIRHTELCFSLARALDGKRESPGPFPEAQSVSTLPRARTLALAKLAVDSLVDGALNEGVSARIIARLSRRCEIPQIREILRQIAADEGRHAAHGWAVVKWCLEVGGAPVGHALLGAVAVLPAQIASSLPGEAAGGGWERWGIAGHPLASEEYAAARAHLRARVREMVRQERAA